ncbi:MAG: ABC transporter ATP-binding protein, partial [Cellulomonadaceae bacterium]|nr:ABC transporter ATP-binding protein [Cellulomonadaceae bacterium]
MTDGVVVTDLVVRSSAGVLVAGTSFTLERGRCLAIIGESGSGKSMTAKAITGLLPGGVTATGSVSYGAETIALPASVQTWHGVRGARAVLLLQDPFTSLSPVHRCGDQVAWSIAAREERHGRPAPRRADAAAEVRTRLAEVGLPDRVARMHPHELSCGIRQRVAIAAALATEPDL